MQQINVSTKVVARVHPDRNGRGLGIFNPYFAQTRVNALYVLCPAPSLPQALDAIRALGLAGAVVAGAFERDPSGLTTVDELSTSAERVRSIGYVVNRGGALVGDYQGGYGLDGALEDLGGVSGKAVSLVGAGHVVHALLLAWQERAAAPADVTIYARDPKRAEALAGEFADVRTVHPLGELSKAPGGDIVVNATPVGSPWAQSDPLPMPDEVLGRFVSLADVTFVPPESDLIKRGKALGLRVSPGTNMFFHQANHVMTNILGAPLDRERFEPIMLADFAINWA